MSHLLVVVALILLGPLAALTPLAYASPPDPVWIGGVYDGDDQDDVIVLITSEHGAVTAAAEPDLLHSPVVGLIPQPGSGSVLPRPVFSLQSRAPPA